MATIQHITAMEPLPANMKGRLLSKVKVEGECWTWQGYRLPGGYGQIGVGARRMRLAHRVSYVVFKGNIPDGLEIDHICRNTSCINPHHLEAVTSSTNARRGNTIARKNAAKTHCKHGHEFTAENTILHKGKYRNCKTCVRASKRKHGSH